MGLVKLLQFALDELGEGLGRPVLCLLGRDFLFLGDHDGIHLVAGHDGRMSGGDLQGDVAHQLLEFLLAHGRFLAGADFHQHPHFGPGVNVGGHHAMATDLQPLMARDPDVLPELGGGGDAVGLQIGIRVGRKFSRHVLGEGAESFVARDEIRFAIELDEDAQALPGLHKFDDQPFLGFAG